MKSNTSKGALQNNQRSLPEIINSLFQNLLSNKLPLALEYVHTCEKFDIVTRPQFTEWILTPDRK